MTVDQCSYVNMNYVISWQLTSSSDCIELFDDSQDFSAVCKIAYCYGKQVVLGQENLIQIIFQTVLIEDSQLETCAELYTTVVLLTEMLLIIENEFEFHKYNV